MPPRLKKLLSYWRIQEMGGLVYLIPAIGLVGLAYALFLAASPATSMKALSRS